MYKNDSFQVCGLLQCTAVCERVTNTPEWSPAGWEPTIEQLLGTLRFRHWDGELLDSCCNFLPVQTHNGPFCLEAAHYSIIDNLISIEILLERQEE